MSFPRRLLVVTFLALIAMCAYGVASYYSPSMVAFVVEQAFLQRLPEKEDPDNCHRRFRSLLASLPDNQARLSRLLAMSQQIEKVQKLSPLEVEMLLSRDGRLPGQAED